MAIFTTGRVDTGTGLFHMKKAPIAPNPQVRAAMQLVVRLDIAFPEPEMDKKQMERKQTTVSRPDATR